jgi:hypothetical protein
MFAATFVAALFMASGAGATTLADLIEPDARLVIGGVVYENFAVKIKGKGLSRDLTNYGVVAEGSGFRIEIASIEPKRGGKIKLKYDASGIDLTHASLSVAAAPGASLRVIRKLFGGKKKPLARMVVMNRAGWLSDEFDLDDRNLLHVRDSVRIRGGGALHTAVVATVIPQPSTGLLLGAGLLGLGLFARRRSRT